jgi:hypothetical protein
MFGFTGVYKPDGADHDAPFAVRRLTEALA